MKFRNLYFQFLLFLFGVFFIQGCGNGLELEGFSPQVGSIQESFTEPAQTRLEKTFPISMPISGRIERIEFEPGDQIKKDQPLIFFDLIPIEEELLEAKSMVEELKAQINVKEDNTLEKTALIDMEQMVSASSETLKASKAQINAAKARSDRASKELARTEKLAKSDAVTLSKLDDSKLEAEVSLIELRKQEFYKAALNALHVGVQLGPRFVKEYINLKTLQKSVLTHRLTQAKTRLARAEHQMNLVNIVSPIEGVVLEKFEQGSRTLPAGHDLLLLGDLNDLEVIADILTQDALSLSIGSKVILKPANRLEPIQGTVKIIEPAGFTKLSSLGVEQQRVNVIVSLESIPENLGVGYRVRATFVTGEKDDALVIPRYSVLQEPNQDYYVFLVSNGKIRKQVIDLGLQSDLNLEVINGLSANEVIVKKPDTTMYEGMKVEIKNGK